MKKIKSDIKSNNTVLKAGAGYVIGNYLLKGITFLSAPIFTRLLTTAEYGDYNLYLTYESIFYIIVGIAIHSSINNAKYKYEEALDKYVSSIVLLAICSAGFWFALVNILYPAFGDFFGFDRVVLNVLVFHCLCSSLLQIFNSYVSLTYSVGSFLKLTSFNGIANIVISLLLILTVFNSQRCLGRIVGTVIPLGLIGLYIVIFFFKKATPHFVISYWKFGVRYSLPIVPHGISQVILSSFDRIMIKQMIGSDESGLYSFSYTICVLLNVATNSLGNVWKPWIYERLTNKDYEAIRKRGTDYAMTMALLTSMAMLATPEIIKVMGDREYWNLTPCVIPVVVGGFLSFLYSLPVMIEYFYEKTKYIAAATGTAAITNIVLNYIFIGKYGYIAAAYTTLFTYLLYFLFHYIVAAKIHGSCLFDSFKFLLIIVLVGIVGACSVIGEKFWYLRWIGVILLALILAIYAEKRLGLVSKIKTRLKK